MTQVFRVINFFEFQENQLLLFSQEKNEGRFVEHTLQTSQPFFREELIEFIRKETQNEAPRVMYWFHPHFAIMPQSVFRSKDIAAYLELNFGANNTLSSPQFDVIHAHQAVVAYSVPTWLQEFKEQYFPLVALKHVGGQLLNRSRNQVEDLVSIVLFENQFLLTITKKGVLQTCNCFSYQNEVDVAYYLLLHFQKLALASHAKCVLYAHSTAINIEQFPSVCEAFAELNAVKWETKTKNQFLSTVLCV